MKTALTPPPATRQAPAHVAPPPIRLASWTRQLGAPVDEPRRSRNLARIGGVAAITSLVAYLTWRVAFTLPVDSGGRGVAWLLIGFEALPLFAITLRTVTLWSIDSPTKPPAPVTHTDLRVAVLIPTYNEPAEVIAPTIAASCALQPAHETWVLDDGDRPWVADLCEAYGARYVRRDKHTHAKAGNINNAMDIMEREQQTGTGRVDVIAVLDCDHVPLPTFLTATLGWFDDERVALVQGPQNYYNAGAFDDDGASGEQGMFFNVLMPARRGYDVGPFWCGSTSLLRFTALREIGGVATETVVEDMHTTLKLIRREWKTIYHHQTLALGLAPSTPEQYLMQRRRWGMGSMQVLAVERLWTAKSWLSWRNFFEYLNGTVWWLEGIATLIAFSLPMALMVSGANTSRADPLAFAGAFAAMFATRLWGVRRLLRKEIHFPTAFALRVLRIPVGVACLWWLLTRRTLSFEVTEKGGATRRQRGRIPRIIWLVAGIVSANAAYAAAGLAGLVPWQSDPSSTAASGAWLLMAAFVLLTGVLRIRHADYATSRRNAHRIRIHAAVEVDGVAGELVDISTGGVAVRMPKGSAPSFGMAELQLPGSPTMKGLTAPLPRRNRESDSHEYVSVQVVGDDWASHRTLSMWMFHTPDGAVPGLRPGVPAVAVC
jgi:cellulose synthase/poly-beta-1,6-N-acetylglucosamine synthase-like glycosyltransferase